MKNIAVLIAIFLDCIVVFQYIKSIRKRDIAPALSTWIIFLAGTSLSLTTYAIAEKSDFLSGIVNTIDVLSVFVILIAILIWGDRKMRFKSFEKWYLAGVGAVISFGFLSGQAWGSNLFAQGLISAGYFPTVQKMFKEKKNTESFSYWSIIALIGAIGLFPACIDGNSLAAIYSIRTIVLVSLLIACMLFFEFRYRRA